jgi:hypothetical protein
LKRQKKKGGMLLVDLVKLAKIAISPALRKGLAAFEVAFTIQSLIFSEIIGVAGFLLVSTWADARGSRAIHRKNCQNLYVTFPDTYAVFLPGERSQGDVGALLAVLRSECDFGGESR